MDEWIYYDIPRIYTALAQWCACMVYICISKRKYRLPQTGGIAIVFLILQCVLMTVTENISIYFWIPVMILSMVLMFFMLVILCNVKMKIKIYYTMCAFLIAESVTAIEWLIYYFIAWIHGYESLVLGLIILLVFYAGCFGLVWAIEKHLLNKIDEFTVSPKEIFMTIGIVISIFVLSNLSYVYPDTPLSSRLFYEVFRIRALIDGFGMILIFFLQLQMKTQLQEIESKAIHMILRSQYEKYKHQQESNEIIHIKYHDLKHQIAAIRAEINREKQNSWLDCIEKEIDTYQAIVNTGNKVIDAIIESKLGSIQKYNIDFTYVVDGNRLAFMHVTDICTIFGNALDNALEAEILEPDQEKRMINLSVSAQRKMTYIKIENYISHPEKLQEDFLETTKADKENHGYGIKSMRHCIERYQGNMSIKIKDNWFSLYIIIPNCD